MHASACEYARKFWCVSHVCRHVCVCDRACVYVREWCVGAFYLCLCMLRQACVHACVHAHMCWLPVSAYVVLKPVTSWVLSHCFTNEAIID